MHDLTGKSVAVVPRKLASIVTLTAEMLTGSNAEPLVTDALTRSVRLALDAALFDSAAADPVRPAGLRYGIAPLAASESTNPAEAMIEDLSALATTVSVIGGQVVFIASPGRAVTLALRVQREPPLSVLASLAVAADDLIAVVGNGLASAIDAVPEIEASRLATVHMDTAPRTPMTLARWRRRQDRCGRPMRSASSFASTRAGLCATRGRWRGRR